MMPSKGRVRSGNSKPRAAKPERRLPTLDALLEARDYLGAITLLNFKRRGAAARADPELAEWLAYAHFHYGEHDKALELYRQLLAGEDPDPLHHTYAAACCYHLGLTQQAVDEAQQGPRCPLATRILFHCAQRAGDNDALMAQHSALGNSLEDQLSLAALHFARGHHQEALGLYKPLLLEHRDLLALSVYVALCYSRLDYYDVSNEVLAAYLAQHPASPAAANLRACNAFRMSNGHAAEAELRALAEATGGRHAQHDLIRHNLVVFRGGEGAAQVLPPLGDFPPEALLNRVIHHLRRGEAFEAHALVGELEPSTPQEYILKGVASVCLGQETGSQEHLAAGQRLLHAVGSSAGECDTIPGRQAMASALFLAGSYDEVLVFLNSIRSFFSSDDDFNWNYGLALVATHKYREAGEALSAVRSEAYRDDPLFVSCLARCLVLTGRAADAWRLYTDASGGGGEAASSEAALSLLRLLGDDCYRVGSFYYALKAFAALEQLDPAPEYHEAKRGAAAGLLQAVAAGREQPSLLAEAVELLQRSTGPATSGPDSRGRAAAALQVEQMVRVIRGWCQMSGT